MNANSIQISIVERVKKAIDINYDIDEYKLYELLTKEIINSHPDKYINADNKKQAEEKFKQLNEIKSEFDIYLEQQRLNRQLAIRTNLDEEKLELFKSSSDKELEILRLNGLIKGQIKEIDNLKKEIEDYQIKLKESQNNYDKRISKELNYSKESISSLYKPRTLSNVFGTATSLGSLSLLLPQVKDLLNNIGFSVFISSFILSSLSIIWILAHFRRFVAIKLSDNIISQIFSNPDINNLFKIKQNFRKAYFTEREIYNIINNQMSRIWMKIFFFGNFDKLKREIVESIILEFEAKKLIIGHRNNGLEKEFIVEQVEHIRYDYTYVKSENDGEPF